VALGVCLTTSAATKCYRSVTITVVGVVAFVLPSGGSGIRSGAFFSTTAGVPAYVHLERRVDSKRVTEIALTASGPQSMYHQLDGAFGAEKASRRSCDPGALRAGLDAIGAGPVVASLPA
jgi:hypothetical protein